MMRRKILTFTIMAALVGLAGCSDPGPKVGEPPEKTSTVPSAPEAAEETLAAEMPAASEDATPEEVPHIMVSHNEGYRMTEVGDWTIERIEPTYPGYPEGEVNDPVEQWLITHPDVDLAGEVILGADLVQTAPRPAVVVESMTEEELPHLSSQYGNAYLVEGLVAVSEVEIYRASIVTDHREDRQIGEEFEYFGDRTPGPRFMFQIHMIEPESFEAYLASDARQDLLEMLRTMEIADPPWSLEGVDMENPPWEE